MTGAATKVEGTGTHAFASETSANMGNAITAGVASMHMVLL